MSEVLIVGVDLAKRVFQLHAADVSGHAIYRKKLSRAQFAKFLAEAPRCVIAQWKPVLPLTTGVEKRNLQDMRCGWFRLGT